MSVKGIIKQAKYSPWSVSNQLLSLFLLQKEAGDGYQSPVQ
jgi:hypothetical protein